MLLMSVASCSHDKALTYRGLLGLMQDQWDMEDGRVGRCEWMNGMVDG